MKKILFVILVAFVLAACGGGNSASAPVAVATVPAEFAGLSNPLGADAATAGAEVLRIIAHPVTVNRDMVMALRGWRLIPSRKTSLSLLPLWLMIICSGVLAPANRVQP